MVMVRRGREDHERVDKMTKVAHGKFEKPCCSSMILFKSFDVLFLTKYRSRIKDSWRRQMSPEAVCWRSLEADIFTQVLQGDVECGGRWRRRTMGVNWDDVVINWRCSDRSESLYQI